MALSQTPTNALNLNVVSTVQLAGSEITAFDPGTDTVWVTSLSGLRVLDFSNPASPTVSRTIDFTAAPYNFSNDVNSVAIKNGIVAVAVNAPTATDNGKVFLFNAATGDLLNTLTVGAVPDNVVFTPDGSKILVANEGESNLDSTTPLTTNPEGSISIIDISGGAASATVATAGFTAFNSSANALIAEGVRLFVNSTAFATAGTTVAQDLEPEYIAVSPDGTKAFVTLQEANSIAIVDIATATVEDIVALGLKDWSTLPFDGSDRDLGPGFSTGIPSFVTGRPIFGIYQPDAIASFTVGGQTYYVAANEGDDRNDFLNPNETTTVGNAGYNLDDTAFPTETTLKLNQNLGRLTVVNLNGLRGDTDNDTDIDQIITYGGRSFSILNSSGAIVFDSGAHIDTTVAALSQANFSDNRSTAKGSEPEGVTTATIDGRVYAFIGLERFAGTMVYDVTNPTDPSFVTFASSPAGFGNNSALQRPEGGLFISAADSPTGRALYLVSNEGTGSGGSLVTYSVNSAPDGVNDSNTGAALVEDGNSAASGNVLTNDTDIDSGDTKTVTGARAGTEAAGGSLTSVSGATIVNGTYGQLTINTDGSWSYALDNSRTVTQALTQGQSVTESFTYALADGGSLTDTAELNLAITGTTERYTLQVLHFSDAEAGTLAPQTAPYLAALADKFEDAYANSITLSSGDNFLPGPFLAAGTDPSLRTVLNSVTGSTIAAGTNLPIGAVDLAILGRIGVDASAIGNHEFDLGSRVFRDAFSPTLGAAGWVGANFPYLSANLLFANNQVTGFTTGDADLGPRFTQTVGTGGLESASSLKGRIAPSAVITENGQTIGIVGATTQVLESISSPSGTEVAGFPYGVGPNGEGNNMALLAAQLQPVIDDLRNQGVNKIVLVSHLQQLQFEQALAPLLNGVDIIIGGGSNTRLGDATDTAVAFPGHSADFDGTYPIVTAGADGKPTLIVNTDGEFTYLGRLVVDFDDDGNIITDSVTDNVGVSGAYAATASNTAAAWGVNEADLATTALASGTRGGDVKALTDAVQNVITVKDGTIFGYTSVYLEGERSQVRSQETNLGSLTADAYINIAKRALGLPADAVVAAINNGGGIRAQIGTIETDYDTGAVVKLPPEVGGEISQLDIENSLRFNNRLMVFDTTAQGLLNILNSPNSLNPGNGGFMQIGGLKVSYNPSLSAGQRVRDVSLVNDLGEIIRLVDDGVVVAGAPATITVVAQNFTANDGDNYAIKANASNFRFLLTDGTVSAPVSSSANFTATNIVPANALGQQDALAQYLQARYPTVDQAFDQAETPQTLDTRIQNQAVRSDTVLQGVALHLGTAANDSFTGTDADEALSGLVGNDSLNAGGGNDVLRGGEGADSLNGGDGTDTASYSQATAGVTANLGTGRGSSGEATGDRFTNIENLEGSAFADTLIGDTGANRIAGGAGNDVLTGARGNDSLVGDAGNDVLQGGVGADTFVFDRVSNGAVDYVTDFQRGQGDVISFGTGVTVTAVQVGFVTTAAAANGVDLDNSANALDLVLTLSSANGTQTVHIIDAYNFASNAYWEGVLGLDLSYTRPNGGDLVAIA